MFKALLLEQVVTAAQVLMEILEEQVLLELLVQQVQQEALLMLAVLLDILLMEKF